jgi:chromate reductase, NAD(P)H dehydrogenase (quinone)
MHQVAVLVGSLRKDSHNRKLAHGLERLGAGSFAFHYPDLNLPLYNEDLWAGPPAGVTALKAAVEAADAVLFVTPEYNRSITPITKNAIDWGSRPWGKTSWPGKPAGIVGISGGQIGTAVAQSQLRGILVNQAMVVMGQPEVYLTMKDGLFAEDGSVTDAGIARFLRGYLDSFAAWIEKHRTR